MWRVRETRNIAGATKAVDNVPNLDTPGTGGTTAKSVQLWHKGKGSGLRQRAGRSFLTVDSDRANP